MVYCMDQWNHNAMDFASSVLQHGLVHVFVDGMAALNELDGTLFFIVQMKHGRDWNDRIRKRTFAQSSRWNAFGWSSSGNRFSCWQTMFWKSTGHISIPKNASTINKSPWDSTVQEKIGRGRLVLKAMETEIHKSSHIIMHHHKPSCISYQKSS